MQPMNALFSKEFASLYTALVWVVFWSVLLITIWKHLLPAITAVVERIRKGADVTLGGVLKLKDAPKAIQEGLPGTVAVSDTAQPGAMPTGISEETINAEYKSLVDQQYFSVFSYPCRRSDFL